MKHFRDLFLLFFGVGGSRFFQCDLQKKNWVTKRDLGQPN